MQTKRLSFETMDQQQAVFGMQDSFVKIIEKALPVTVSLRDSRVEIRGVSERDVKLAADVMISLRQMYDQGEKLNTDTVYRLLEDVQDGTLDETFQAMGSVVALNHKGVPIKCKTMGQKNYVKALRENVVTICIGPAGTGKTYLAVAQAAKELRDGQIDRIIMSRPAIEAGEERLGFLPGDLAQKVDPYLRPLYDALHEIMGAETFQKNMEKGLIEVAPLAYMRGRTLDNAFVVLDEAQNTTPAQMKMFLTRIGFGSKAIITGDMTQKDLPDGTRSGLDDALRVLKNIDEIGVCMLTSQDVVRHPLVQKIVSAYDADEKRREARSRARRAEMEGKGESRKEKAAHRRKR